MTVTWTVSIGDEEEEGRLVEGLDIGLEEGRRGRVCF